MIRLQNIEKVYRTDTIETLAINDISLHIAKGEFFQSWALRVVVKVRCSISWACWMNHQGATSKLITRTSANFSDRKAGTLQKSETWIYLPELPPGE